jgi:hypothetical protein
MPHKLYGIFCYTKQDNANEMIKKEFAMLGDDTFFNSYCKRQCRTMSLAMAMSLKAVAEDKGDMSIQ